MTSMCSTSTSAVVESHGFARPTVVDVYDAIVRTFGPDGEATWTHLCGQALARMDGPLCVDALLDVLEAHEDRVLQLMGRSMRIRVRAFDRLSGDA